MTRFVDLEEGLKLTKDQKDRLQKGEELTKVLDDQQKATWKGMLGEPFAKVASLTTRPAGFAPAGGGALGGGPGGFGRITNTRLQYLVEKSVQEELKLREDQTKQLPELMKKWEELTNNIAGRRTGDEYRKKMDEATASLAKVIATVLDEKQLSRLVQIERQQLERRGFSILLAAKVVQDELTLSEEQRKAIATLNTESTAIMSLISTELGRFTERGTDPDYTKTVAEFNKRRTEKLKSVLTPAQHEKIKTLLGEPFKGELRLNRGTFGGGAGGIPG